MASRLMQAMTSADGWESFSQVVPQVEASPAHQPGSPEMANAMLSAQCTVNCRVSVGRLSVILRHEGSPAAAAISLAFNVVSGIVGRGEVLRKLRMTHEDRLPDTRQLILHYVLSQGSQVKLTARSASKGQPTSVGFSD